MHSARARDLGGLLAIVLGLSAGCSSSSGTTGQGAPRAGDVPPVTLSIQGATNAAPSVAASGERVVVTWAATVEGRTNVYAATSADAGATFGSPVRVNDIDGDARVNGEQAPRAAFGDDLVVAWVSKLSDQSRLRLARSADGGRTFAAAVTPHADNLTGARGWASVTVDRGGVVHAVWLDGRNAHGDDAPPPAGHDHHMRQDIYQAAIRPDGTRQETRVATDVCFCCKTAVVTASDGVTYVAWRHVYPTNLRDIAVARSTDGGRTFSEPVRVSEDHWQIDGCPEDGPSTAVTRDGVLHIVWPTLVQGTDGRKGIFYTFSADGGRTFAPRVRLDREEDVTTQAAHPQLSVTGAGVTAVWDDSTGSSRRIRARQIVLSSGTNAWAPAASAALVVSANGERSTYPAIAGTRDGAVVAWTITGAAATEVRVKRLRW